MGKTMAQNAESPLPFDVGSTTEGSLMGRLVIYKQLERERGREREREGERERERDYFIGEFKHYLPLTGTIFGFKRKTALDAQ